MILISSFLEVGSSSNFSLKGIGLSSIGSVSGSNISGFLGFEGLLITNKFSSSSFFRNESSIRRTKWICGLGVHGIKLCVGYCFEWGCSSIHHVDSGCCIVPFLFVGGGNIIGVVLSNHCVVLSLESLLLGNSGS